MKKVTYHGYEFEVRNNKLTKMEPTGETREVHYAEGETVPDVIIENIRLPGTKGTEWRKGSSVGPGAGDSKYMANYDKLDWRN